jgi:hypothetical protein
VVAAAAELVHQGRRVSARRRWSPRRPNSCTQVDARSARRAVAAELKHQVGAHQVDALRAARVVAAAAELVHQVARWTPTMT